MSHEADSYNDTTVIVPIKNEPAQAINGVLQDIIENMPSSKIIVIYKGASNVDNRYANKLLLIEQKGNGKGNACYEAAKHVHTEIMCFIDGDMTYSARDLKRLVAAVRNGADLAIGNRLYKLSTKVMPHYIQLGNSILTATLNLLYRTNFKDSQTGLRAMKKSAFLSLEMREQHFGFEEEMLIKAKRRNLKIIEMPISYSIREGQSKQMKPLDGIKLLLILFRHIFD